jgi:lipoate---protein ligase
VLDILPYAREDDLVAATRADGRARGEIYRPDHVAVVLGRGGDPARELSPAAIAADGVPVYRRPGGGGAVVLDPGNLVVALALPLPGLGGIPAAFRLASDLVIAALADCGVPGVAQRGISDLAVGDRKLGGSCLRRERGLAHYATTLLVDPDLTLMDRYLPLPPREPDYRAGRAHRDFVTSLRRQGLTVAPDDLRRRLAAALDLRISRIHI